jgi:hypothetical protein
VTEVASEKELIVELARGTSGDAEESGELLVAAASAAFGRRAVITGLKLRELFVLPQLASSWLIPDT